MALRVFSPRATAGPSHSRAALAGGGESLERACLSALAESKVIVRRKRRWVARSVLTGDTRRDPGAGRALKSHWARVAEQRLPLLEPGGEDLFSYNLFTVSEKTWERLRELHIAYFPELRRVIGASSAGERAALVNLQLFRLDQTCVAGPPGAGASRPGELVSAAWHETRLRSLANEPP